MCRIEDADGVLIPVPTPEGVLMRCSECSQDAGADGTVESFVCDEDYTLDRDVRNWLLWHIAENRWATSDDDERDGVEFRPFIGPVTYTGEDFVTVYDWFSATGYDDVPPGIPLPRPQSFVTCARCLAARQWLRDWCGGWLFDCVLDEIVEHWDEGEVPATFAFARLVVWIKHRWTFRGRTITPAEVTALVEASLRSFKDPLAA